MLLPDHRILAMIESHGLGIEPFNDAQVQPASYDLTLSPDFLVPQPVTEDWSTDYYVDPSKPPQNRDLPITVPDGQPFELKPGEFVLASTVEKVSLPAHLAGVVAGKSSLARRGLQVEAAGFVDPGFTGQITCELFNQHRDKAILLWPGMRIAQIVFQQLASPAQFPYGHERNGSHYQHQLGPTASRSHEGFQTAPHTPAELPEVAAA